MWGGFADTLVGSALGTFSSPVFLDVWYLDYPSRKRAVFWMEGFVRISNSFQRLPQTTRSIPNLLRHPGQTWRISLSDRVSCTNLTFWLLLGKEKRAKRHRWRRGVVSGDIWPFLKETSTLFILLQERKLRFQLGKRGCSLAQIQVACLALLTAVFACETAHYEDSWLLGRASSVCITQHFHPCSWHK